ncbi:MAG: abortive infection family protein [Thermoanaerobaculia bacterium]
MITLYGGTGASDYGLEGESPRPWFAARAKATRLLRARDANTAADLLERSVAGLYRATNHFNDEFEVLVLTLPMTEYLPIADDQKSWRPVFRDIATTLLEAGEYVRFIAIELSDDLVTGVPSPIADPSEATVTRALRDAEQLLISSGPQSAADRFYTALHARLRLLAIATGHDASADASITELYKYIRSTRASPITPRGARAAAVERVLVALATIVDSLKPVRNRTTLAHPSDALLDEPEATLVVNCMKALLVYFTQKK